MNVPTRRVALSIADGYVPGLDAVVMGTVLAAGQLGWEVVGIHDGFDGLLCPGSYADGGLVLFTNQMVMHQANAGALLLGTTARIDPFRARTVNAENQVEEVDRSEELLEAIRVQKLDGVIAIVGSRGLSTLFKLSRKGLKLVCVPKSVENDLAATLLSFGFNSALSFATEILERARQAAEAARKIGVVEVLGEHAGWLACKPAWPCVPMQFSSQRFPMTCARLPPSSAIKRRQDEPMDWSWWRREPNPFLIRRTRAGRVLLILCGHLFLPWPLAPKEVTSSTDQATSPRTWPCNSSV